MMCEAECRMRYNFDCSYGTLAALDILFLLVPLQRKSKPPDAIGARGAARFHPTLTVTLHQGLHPRSWPVTGPAVIPYWPGKRSRMRSRVVFPTLLRKGLSASDPFSLDAGGAGSCPAHCFFYSDV